MKNSIMEFMRFCLIKSIWLIPVGLIILHALLFSIYLHQKNLLNQHSKEYLFHQFILQGLLTTQQYSPQLFNQRLYSLVQHPTRLGNQQITLSVTDKPLHTIIDNKFILPSSNLSLTAMSMPLATDKWLNYKIQPFYTTSIILTILFLFEQVILIAFLFYIFSIYRFKKPLLQIKNSATQLGISLQPLKYHKIGPGIVQETVQTLQTLQQRILQLLKRRTHILAAISHDLRSSLTKIKLRCQLLTDEAAAEKINHDLDEIVW